MNIDLRFSFRIEYSPTRDIYQLFAFNRDPALAAQGKIGFASPITFQSVDPGDTIDPTLALSKDSAQLLFDELWKSGFRPQREASAGQLEAVTAHLQDQRQICARLFDLVEQSLAIERDRERK